MASVEVTVAKILERTGQAGVFTIPLDAVRLKDLPRVGGKASRLGEMLAAGLPAPTGFVVTTDACKRFMQFDSRIEDCLKGLEQCDIREPAVLCTAAEEFREKLGAIPMPGEVAEDIAAALAETSGSAWAVRSSATVEDLAEASFAGQHDSFLNARGSDAVVVAVRRCWLSLYSERAISYRMRKGIAPGRAQMAVVVQQLIPANAAGVMFTKNPAGGDSILIEASFGLGEAVVQGKVTPDRVEVSRSELKVIRRETNLKQAQFVADENGVRKELLAKEQTNAPVLDDKTAVRLAELGLNVERLFGGPQDIEWARYDSKLFLLQSRPITSQAPVKTWRDRQVWSNFNTGEIAPDVMAPITWSLMQSLSRGTAFRSLFRLLGADVQRAPLLGLVAGRLYFNANTAMAALRPFPFLHNGATILFQAVGGGQIEAYRQAQAIPPEDLPDLGFRWPKYLLS